MKTHENLWENLKDFRSSIGEKLFDQYYDGLVERLPWPVEESGKSLIVKIT